MSSILRNDDVIIEDELELDDDSSVDAQRVAEFEREHLSQEEIDLVNAVCKY